MARLQRSQIPVEHDFSRTRSMLASVTVAASVLAAGLCLDATTLVPADLKDLVTGSRAIVHGRVVDTRAEMVDNRRHIETLVSLEVEEYYKGDLGREVTIRVPGGELGRYRNVLIGAPRFAVGEEVVLFLNSRGSSMPYVLGLSQGVFRVARDPRTGAKIVTPAPLLSHSAAPEPILRGDARRRMTPLADFGRQVRSMAAGSGQPNATLPPPRGTPRRERVP